MLTKNTQFRDNPLAPLGWATTLTVAALEKLLDGQPIDETEEEAIEQVAEEIGALSRTNKEPLEEFLRGDRAWPPDLMRNFSTLLAIQPSADERSFSLDTTAENLRYVADWIQLPREGRANLDHGRVEGAQRDCLEILRQLSSECLQEGDSSKRAGSCN